MKIRSSRLHHLILKGDLTTFLLEIRKEPKRLFSIHKGNTIFHYLLRDGRRDFISASVLILREHKEIFDSDEHLFTLQVFMCRVRQKLPQEDASHVKGIMMSVLELYKVEDVCQYLHVIVEILPVLDRTEWEKLILKLGNINGVRRLFDIDLKSPLPVLVIHLINTTRMRLTVEDKLHLASITLSEWLLDKICLIDMIDVHSFDFFKMFCRFISVPAVLNSMRFHFKQLLYAKLTAFPCLQSHCDKIRKYALRNDSDIQLLNCIVQIDRINNIVYTEEQYISAAIKSSAPFTSEYVSAWVQHYGCTTSGMLIRRDVLFDEVRLPNKSAELSYVMFNNNGEALVEETNAARSDLLDVGVILLKKYIENQELLRLLLLYNMVDLTVYHSSKDVLNKVLSHQQNPLLLEGQGIVNILLILNRIHANSMYITKTSKFDGTSVIRAFSERMKHPYSEEVLKGMELLYDQFMQRDFSSIARTDLTRIFILTIIWLFDNIPMINGFKVVPKQDNSHRIYDSRFVIFKKLAQKGVDISFFGRLFSDYQSYYYTTKLDIFPEIRTKIASYLDFRLIFNDPSINKAIRKEHACFSNQWLSST